MYRWLACWAVVGACGRLGFDEQQVGSSPDSAGDPVDATSPDAPPNAVIVVVGDNFLADTYLSLDPGQETTNFGDSAILDVDIAHSRTLIRFELVTVPTTATVFSASLAVATTNNGGAEGSALSVFPILEPWSESAVCFNDRLGNTAWSGPGASPPSRGATAIGSITPSAKNTRFTTSLDLAVVQSWVSSPTMNFGMTLIDSDGCELVSSEGTPVANRPRLTIVYVP